MAYTSKGTILDTIGYFLVPPFVFYLVNPVSYPAIDGYATLNAKAAGLPQTALENSN